MDGTEDIVLAALEMGTKDEYVSIRGRAGRWLCKKESPSGMEAAVITDTDGLSDIMLPICTEPAPCRVMDAVGCMCDSSSIESCLKCSLLRSFSAAARNTDDAHGLQFLLTPDEVEHCCAQSKLLRSVNKH